MCVLQSDVEWEDEKKDQNKAKEKNRNKGKQLI